MVAEEREITKIVNVYKSEKLYLHILESWDLAVFEVPTKMC